jgi:Protein of unknown function (DUF3306)
MRNIFISIAMIFALFLGALPAAHAQAAFDPASLPPVESISGSTDIRSFLLPGVPAALTQAALRRAWTTDPAIRDFIGIADQLDFTDPTGIPGFGPLTAADEISGTAGPFASSSGFSAASSAAAEGAPMILSAPK